MTEGLFILTTIFVAYVVYSVIGEQSAKPKAPEAKPEPQATPAAEQPKPQVAVAQEQATVKPATAKAAPAKTAPPKTPASTTAAAKTASKPTAAKKTASAKAAKKTTAAAAKSAGLKDPKTGEIVSTYGNYRFTKRWIKDALVAEGLLEKVYTATELNAETEAKIKEAIAKLEALDKYKA